MSADKQTLAFYDGEAVAYASYASNTEEHLWLAEFANRLTPAARVLDFGCGSGWAAGGLKDKGFEVSAIDGSAGLATEAKKRYGIDVRVMQFDELADRGLYTGVWASFCLLHDTREAMPGHLARLYDALRPGGWLYLGLKEGTGESRDKLGRRYTYFGEAEIIGLLNDAGFEHVEATIAQSEGYDGTPTGVIHILARRDG